MTQELMERPSQAVAVVDRGYLTSQDVLARMTRILEIQKAVMKERVHFGTIPGTPKPTLYKAGAEKLLSTFQIAAVPSAVEDLSTPDEIRYRVRVQGVASTGVVLGEAWGECSSNEEKYRWRKPVCDEEFVDTPADQRREVWKKYQGKAYKAKQVRTSPADVANTILQMATKRALIPMTRVVLACSDIFDQDLEDMPEELRESILEHEGGPAAPAPMQPPQRRSEQAGTAQQPASDQEQPPCHGAARVTSVVPRQGETNGKKWTLFVVKFSDGREGSTLNETVANVAIDMRDRRTWVIPTLSPSEKKPGSFQLVEMAIAQS